MSADQDQGQLFTELCSVNHIFICTWMSIFILLFYKLSADTLRFKKNNKTCKLKNSNVLNLWGKNSFTWDQKGNNVGAMEMFYKRDPLLAINLLAGGISRRQRLKRLRESCKKKNLKCCQKFSGSRERQYYQVHHIISFIFLEQVTSVLNQSQIINNLIFTILCVWQTIHCFYYFPFSQIIKFLPIFSDMVSCNQQKVSEVNCITNYFAFALLLLSILCTSLFKSITLYISLNFP